MYQLPFSRLFNPPTSWQRMFCLLPLLIAACRTPAEEAPPVPQWIWHQSQGELSSGLEIIYVRKEFSIPGPVKTAELKVCGDDVAVVFLNGEHVIEAGARANRQARHYSASAVDVTSRLRPGANLITAHVRNSGGPYGLIAKLEMEMADGKRQTLITDSSWITSAELVPGWETLEFKPEGWNPALRIAQDGDNPWFEVMNPPTTASQLELPPGFKADLLREAAPGEGSWIAMTIDQKNRLIVSPQELISPESGGMLRLTLDADGRIAREEPIRLPVGGAQGLLYAHDSLYAVAYANDTEPESLGLYRLQDSDGDDQYDSFKLLKRLYNRGGSHGPHGLALGPDQMIYHISGDYSKVVDDISPGSPHRNYQEDHMLPREWDASGHARGVVAPMGHVQRTDPEGRHWELVAAGLRNPYDLDFNPEGELFTYDADMEYDTGLPWYRPTRIYQIVSGGEYGHREGTGKWPFYYPDSLPPAAVIGLGSPTGVKFGTRSHFPPKYRRALFVCDWAWGRIYAVHLQPEGAGYRAEFEVFAKGRPLNAMDVEFGPDGALYLITGGNETHTGLYRISYTGPQQEEPALSAAQADRLKRAAESRVLRRHLETFHGKKDPAAVTAAWPHLDSPDRWIRYAARIALESQEVTLWRQKALEERRPRASLTALLALARRAGKSGLPAILQSLQSLSWAELSEDQKFELLRVYAVAFARLGPPSAADRASLLRTFDPLFPAQGDLLNRELVQLLVLLEAPDLVGRALQLVEASPSQEQQIHFMFYLRNLASGWTLEQRKSYFAWYQKAAREFSGGVSFHRYLANFREQAAATLNEEEKLLLADYLKDAAGPEANTVQRPFVKAWTLEELQPALDEAGARRSATRGKVAYEAAQCRSCHRFGGEGGSVGPDLTGVSARFGRQDLLEAIVAPSRVVMEQYQNTQVQTKDGQVHIGRIVEETDTGLVLLTDPLKLERAEIKKADIQARRPSEVSPMPEGLVHVLTRDEIMDLIAYLEAGPAS